MMSQNNRKKLLRSFTISETEQLRFAELSRDYNDIHLDARIAENSGLEGVVVHGIHLLLIALSALLKDRDFVFRSLKVKFTKPVYVGQEVDLMVEDADNGVGIQILAGQSISVSIKAEEGSDLKLDDFSDYLVEPYSAREAEDHDVSERSYSGIIPLYIPKNDLGVDWARLSASLGAKRLVSLISLTTIVGMRYPGKYSLFSSCKIEFNGKNNSQIDFRLANVDDRLKLVRLKVEGAGLTATIEAFLRPPIETLISREVLERRINPDSFGNQRVLVIGGSQGIGSILTQILATGGSKVTATYHRNPDKLEEIQTALEARGQGIEVLSCDVKAAGEFENILSGKDYNAIYLCATPRIFNRKTANFDPALMNDYVSYYVGPLEVISAFFSGQEKSHQTAVFVPSTVGIDQPVDGLEEYSAVKLLSERLALRIELRNPFSKFFTPRLDRIRTRQTNTVNPIRSSDGFDEMVDVCEGVSKYLTSN
jgi:acyl dehydratase